MTMKTTNTIYFEEKLSRDMVAKYIALAVLFVINFSMLCVSVVMGYKLISFMGLTLSTGIFAFPLSYVCQDIITEIYGFRLARALIWVTFSVLLLFSLFITILVDLTPIVLWHHQQAYSVVLGHIFRLSFAIVVSLIIGDFLNAAALSKWKILLKGKRFWLRSFGSTAIGEAVDTVIGFGVAFTGFVSLEKFFLLVASTYSVKLIWSAVLILPSSITVSFLKKILKLDVYDYGLSFNPFDLSVKGEMR